MRKNGQSVVIFQNIGSTGSQGSQCGKGEKGEKGEQGADGVGVPAGGVTGQVLTKASGADYDTKWADPVGGDGGGYLGPITTDDVVSTIQGEEVTQTQINAGLQGQIDAINAKSDVTDVVATRVALDAYNTTVLQSGNIIKVLSDETYDDAETYYRWNGTDFDFVGSSGAKYTKAQVDTMLADLRGEIQDGSVAETILLYADAWEDTSEPYTQTVTIRNLTKSNNILVTPSATAADLNAWMSSGIIARDPVNNTITFEARTAKPQTNIRGNVLVFGGVGSSLTFNAGSPILLPSYKTYGVAIDETNSDPLTAVTYIDDAVGMVKGSSAWDTMPIYKDIRPCLQRYKRGDDTPPEVIAYLNPNDYTRDVDGMDVTNYITTGTDGEYLINVMVEHPHAGFQFASPTLNKPEWRLTAQHSKPGFCYDAVSRNAVGDRSKFYVGAYLGWYDGTSLRSLSGKMPTTNITIGTARNYAQANGMGFQQLTWGIMRYLHVLYLIRFGNRNSQMAIGQGNTTSLQFAMTGNTNKNGMYYGTQSGIEQMKCFGIEDLWGNVAVYADGLYINSAYEALSAYKSFNDTGAGYHNNGKLATADVDGYTQYTQSTNACGALIRAGAYGSATTHYCDTSAIVQSAFMVVGGSNHGTTGAGIFLLRGLTNSIAPTNFGARLCYI